MKFFKKINIIDVLVVLLIVICVFGAYYKYFAKGGIILLGNKKIEYTFEVKGVRDYSVIAFKKGGVVSDPKTKKPVGEIVDVASSPAIGEDQLTDGTYVQAPIPDRFDTLITIETEGRVSNTAYYNSGNSELCVGKYYLFNSEYGSLYGVTREIKEL